MNTSGPCVLDLSYGVQNSNFLYEELYTTLRGIETLHIAMNN